MPLPCSRWLPPRIRRREESSSRACRPRRRRRRPCACASAVCSIPGATMTARLAGATSLVSVTALALTVVMSTQVGPVVVFLEATGIHVPSCPGRAGNRRAPRAGARGPRDRERERHRERRAVVPKRPPRGTIPTLERPAQSEPSAVTARPVAVSASETPLDGAARQPHRGRERRRVRPRVAALDSTGGHRADAGRCTLGSRQRLPRRPPPRMSRERR